MASYASMHNIPDKSISCSLSGLQKISDPLGVNANIVMLFSVGRERDFIRINQGKSERERITAKEREKMEAHVHTMRVQATIDCFA